jgi:hypothetical protein
MPRLGDRNEKRVNFQKPALSSWSRMPWIECSITDISAGGVCLNIGALVIPEVFVLVLNPSGSIRRACHRMWRRGELVGARFVTAKQTRDGLHKPPALRLA